MRAADFRAVAALEMSERALQDAVLELAKRLGWLTYHTHDSRHSAAGFPDLVLVHLARPRLLVVELKSQHGQLRAAQKTWLRALAAAGVRTAIWRPGDLLAGTIRDELARPPPALAGTSHNRSRGTQHRWSGSGTPTTRRSIRASSTSSSTRRPTGDR